MPPGFLYGVAEQHQLAIRLRFRGGSYADVRGVWRAVGLDERTIVTETFDGGAEEVAATIRYDGDPGSLLALLRAGAGGTVLTYRPDLADDEVEFPVVLMNHGPLCRIAPDRGRFAYGEWEVDVVLRRVDGGSLLTLAQPGAPT
jgi:hypothetical protein